jgi:hypothetical protein
LATGATLFHGLIDKPQKLRVSSKAKHVARTHVTEHGIGSLKPELSLEVVLKKLKDKIANIGNGFEVLTNFFRSFRIESDGTLGGTRHASNVTNSKSREVSNLLIVQCVAFPEMQAIAGNGAEEVRVCDGWIPSRG